MFRPTPNVRYRPPGSRTAARRSSIRQRVVHKLSEPVLKSAMLTPSPIFPGRANVTQIPNAIELIPSVPGEVEGWITKGSFDLTNSLELFARIPFVKRPGSEIPLALSNSLLPTSHRRTVPQF